ncbi:hypothetical protein CDAR_294891 [Caerostris darwini]|uniref:Uncharacterized protein n=1 Tax=Caerostris darwini TaxID=1538125 RepID=A0AAV4UKG6_9ARAC|nr:hypothetical protein CDAR_294891 [Caerostris darwini]
MQKPREKAGAIRHLPPRKRVASGRRERGGEIDKDEVCRCRWTGMLKKHNRNRVSTMHLFNLSLSSMFFNNGEMYGEFPGTPTEHLPLRYVTHSGSCAETRALQTTERDATSGEEAKNRNISMGRGKGLAKAWPRTLPGSHEIGSVEGPHSPPMRTCDGVPSHPFHETRKTK